MAVFPKMGPVVLLAVKLSLFFIVPVRQDTATFTAPKTQMEVGGQKSRQNNKMRGRRFKFRLYNDTCCRDALQ